MRTLFTLVIFLSLALLPTVTFAQAPFSLHLEPLVIDGFRGAQSFTLGQYGPYLVLIGGRTDGLHQRQPFAAFDPADNNARILLLNPEEDGYWEASLEELPSPIREQLQSTNLQFHQEDHTLYLMGGYGYSATAGGHITYDKLTAVEVPALVEAILNNEPISPYFRQITDDRLAVAGGAVEKVGNFYFLVGGHRFTGRYNPHNGPSFVQEYTNEIRKFRILDDGENLSITDYEATYDAVNLHRRDYNLVSQVFPDGTLGMTAFSGVFQHNQDLPFLNSVDIHLEGFQANNDFNQYLNHYHSGTTALYDAEGNNMYSLFFGGISQYSLDDSGNLVEDAEVPFVSTIGLVSRDGNGNMEERQVGKLPALLGAGAVFSLHPQVPAFAPGIVDLNALAADTVLLGYLIGGIESSQPNIFFINTGEESWAYPGIFKVFISNGTASSAPVSRATPLLRHFQLFPNPAHDTVYLSFGLSEASPVTITIQDLDGRIALQKYLGWYSAGDTEAAINLSQLPAGGYLITASAGQFQKNHKFFLF